MDIFEQHMLEEDSIRVDWTSGAPKEGAQRCPTCGDWNVWDSMHDCCRRECKHTINALQSYPLAAWDDVSMTKLDPEKVVAGRKLEIDYANKMKVWTKIPRRMAKERGWRIIKSRWLDINK